MDGFIFKAMILIRAQADQKVIKKAFFHASGEFFTGCIVEEKESERVSESKNDLLFSLSFAVVL